MLTIAMFASLVNILQSSTLFLTQSTHQIYSERRKRRIHRISGHHDNQESRWNNKNQPLQKSHTYWQIPSIKLSPALSTQTLKVRVRTSHPGVRVRVRTSSKEHPFYWCRQTIRSATRGRRSKDQWLHRFTTVSTNHFQTNRGFVTLPYLQGILKKIARTLNHVNIKVAHKSVMIVGSILKKPKDKFSKELSTGVIYKINCKDCDKVYIGQTSRALRSRTREHKRAIFTGDRNSLLTQYCIKTIMILTLTMSRSSTYVPNGQKDYF